MNTATSIRPISVTERDFLEGLLRSAPTNAARWRQMAAGFVVTWTAGLLVVVVLWLVIAWVANATSGMNIGFRTSAAAWVLGVSIPLVAIWSAIYNYKWYSRFKDPRPQLEQDLRNGEVVEEHHVFTEAKAFQEPEHGGLIYFFRESEDRAYAVYDHESQDLGIQGLNPRDSKFVPRTELRVVRAPATRYVLEQRFSGIELPLPAVTDLALPPSQWPQQDEYTSVPWSQLAVRFGRQPTKDAT